MNNMNTLRQTESSERISVGTVAVLLLLAVLAALHSKGAEGSTDPLRTGHFLWTASEPLVSPADRPDDPCYSVKDPSVVRFENHWHLSAAGMSGIEHRRAACPRDPACQARRPAGRNGLLLCPCQPEMLLYWFNQVVDHIHMH
jgi:hypothetical protein